MELTSLNLTKEFSASHSNFFKKITKIKKAFVDNPKFIFEEELYTSSMGKKIKIYKLNHHSYMFLALRFTGEKNLDKQIDIFKNYVDVIIKKQMN